MSKRSVLLGIALSLASVLGLVAGLEYLSETRRVTRARFERVKKGMSFEQVVQIVGRQPGDYTTGRYAILPHGIRYWKYKSWLCDEGQLLVWFNEDGTAVDVVVCDIDDFRPLTPIERLRRWARQFGPSIWPR
jgi:hypothetical protein